MSPLTQLRPLQHRCALMAQGARIGLLMLLITGVSPSLSASHPGQEPPDLIHLRDGSVLEGDIRNKYAGGFRIQLPDTPLATQLAHHQVAFVIYGSTDKLNRFVDLPTWRSSLRDQDASGELLPTRPYGEGLMQLLQAAEESIDFAAYFISDINLSRIAPYIEALKQAASRGVEVRILLSDDQGSNFGVRQSNLEAAKHFQKIKLETRLSRSGQLMHKKMVIIDGRTLLAGSSNLSVSSLFSGDNMNARIENAPRALAEAVADFENLWKAARQP